MLGETTDLDVVEQHEIFYALFGAIITTDPPVGTDILHRAWKVRKPGKEA